MSCLSSQHYLDHAATSPVREAALEAWVSTTRALREVPGNPAALHTGGRAARLVLEEARERIAGALGAERAEVVLTSGATESDALAVAGGARGARRRDPRRTHVLVSCIEHDAVGAQRRVLEPQGFTWDTLPLGTEGVSVVDPEELAARAPLTALASLALVCSEIGTIQPVSALVEALGSAQAGEGRGPSTDRPLVHTDAAQAVSTLEVDFHTLGVDLMSVGGHKLGAPVGTGALLVRRGVPLAGDRPGGGQERELRSGTVDVAGAAALAAALEEVVAQRRRARKWAELLRERILTGLPEGVRPTLVRETPAVPTIVHLSLETTHPEAVLMAMDAAGVMVSAGSACHAGVTRPSEVVRAMGRSEEEALGVLRVSTGDSTTTQDVDALLGALPGALAAGRALDGRGRGHRGARGAGGETVVGEVAAR